VVILVPLSSDTPQAELALSVEEPSSRCLRPKLRKVQSGVTTARLGHLLWIRGGGGCGGLLSIAHHVGVTNVASPNAVGVERELIYFLYFILYNLADYLLFSFPDFQSAGLHKLI
jgi:hypothetical protein